MIKVDESELSLREDGLEYFQGEPFTGYSVCCDRGFVSVEAFIIGFRFGISYEVSCETGCLVEIVPLAFYGMPIGGVFQWSLSGRLESEVVAGFNSSNRVLREWGKEGEIKSDHREKGVAHDRILGASGMEFVPWIKKPNARVGSSGRNYDIDGYVLEGEVWWDSLDERFRLRGEAFWGRLLSLTDEGRTRMRQVLDGREEGLVWEWSPVGKLVLQGVLHHPYGSVGPWHEWDETGRLVSETIYDALGNRIIDRRLDEVGNIAHEERYEPARLWRDPDTGNERPAPWLWF